MKTCRALQSLFGAAYLVALVIFAVGTFGLFGQPRDPMTGIYLLLLGLPWNRIGLPEPALTWLVLLAPALNLLILVAICRLSRLRSR